MADQSRSAGAHPPDQGANPSPSTGQVPSAPPAQGDDKPPAHGSMPRQQGPKRRHFPRSKRPQGRRRGPSTDGRLFAALDLGTNNCRLLIARPTDRGFRVIDGFTRIVRLGEGLSQTGRLDDAAMTRTVAALKQCQNKLQNHMPTAMRLVATEACRSAENAPEFLDRVRSETGLELEIIDRQTEAQLAVTGCADLMEAEAQGALLFDIGGGSSELAWLDFRGGRPKRHGKMASSIRSWQSLPIGVVSIAEKFGGVDVSKESFEAMVAYVAEHLRHFKGRHKLSQMIAEHPVHLIGTSGTVTTLAGLHLGLERYERAKIDGLWLNSDHITDTMRVLLNMPYERRVANPCIGRDRADLVIPGCAIFEAIRREWPTQKVRVADRGLREGILVSLMDSTQAPRHHPARGRHRPKSSSRPNSGGPDGTKSTV